MNQRYPFAKAFLPLICFLVATPPEGAYASYLSCGAIRVATLVRAPRLLSRLARYGYSTQSTELYTPEEQKESFEKLRKLIEHASALQKEKLMTEEMAESFGARIQAIANDALGLPRKERKALALCECCRRNHSYGSVETPIVSEPVKCLFFGETARFDCDDPHYDITLYKPTCYGGDRQVVHITPPYQTFVSDKLELRPSKIHHPSAAQNREFTYLKKLVEDASSELNKGQLRKEVAKDLEEQMHSAIHNALMLSTESPNKLQKLWECSNCGGFDATSAIPWQLKQLINGQEARFSSDEPPYFDVTVYSVYHWGYDMGDDGVVGITLSAGHI